jgi:hypothetical protein
MPDHYGWVMLGSILPDILRLHRWFRDPLNAQAKQFPFTIWVMGGAAITAVVLGLVVAKLLAPTTALLAVAVGYSGPSLLESIIKSSTAELQRRAEGPTVAAGTAPTGRGAAPPPAPRRRLIDLWRI